MATYGSFPGVRVTTRSGGITSIAIGEEEKLVIFGEANYDSSNNVEGDDSTLSIDTSSPEQIVSNNDANDKFGSDSELADAMIAARSNGANIDYLYGVAVPREDVTGESISGSSGATGTLTNTEIVEDVDTISFDNSLTVEFRYDGAPSTDGGYAAGDVPDDTIFINPLTGEYAVTSGAVGAAPTTIDYTYNDYSTAFNASDVQSVVNEDETGIYVSLSDSDAVNSSLQSAVNALRQNFQLVNGLAGAEPNDFELLDAAGTRGGADARYDTDNYSASGSQSVTEEYMYLFAPVRLENERATLLGAIGGLFAGNPIEDPIYNEALAGVSGVEQTFSKTDADNMRAEDIIPVRDAGAIRVKGNRSTAFSEADAVAADFWTRRITDRVILIAKQVGDRIIGRINDEDTRDQARRLIEAEMRELVRNRLIRSNADDETNWFVEVSEDSTNAEEVNIDVSFTPYGIVKRVDETITVDTSV